MAVFLNHYELRKEIRLLFEDASFLMIVSPFIKLDPQLKRILEKKINDSDFELLILYGKNEHDLSKSLNEEDFNFFKHFRNVEIRYNSDLHAKYYANDDTSIITSLNLHQFSLRNNIESGVKFERSVLGGFFGGDNSNDDDAYKYFRTIFDSSEEIYVKRINEKRRFFGLIKISETTEIDVDVSADIYKQNVSNSPEVLKNVNKVKGYCIRSGVSIPFNLDKPLSKESYESWARYSNPNYPEKYCHYSGKPSNGQTTLNRPVLREYYSIAIKLMKDK